MSQPRQNIEDENDPLMVPFSSIEQGIQVFKNAEKLPEAFRVGTEYEQFALDQEGCPLPFSGRADSIESILKSIAEQTGGELLKDKTAVVGVALAKGTVSLEPGGQIELSGHPWKTVHETAREINEFEELLQSLVTPLHVRLVKVGYYLSPNEKIPSWVPKQRYGIMKNYMPLKGQRGIDMMLRTCTVQANLDYFDEQHMVKAFRTALSLSPLVTALFANSPKREGGQLKYATERTAVWENTDPDRCGFPDIVFQDNFGYEAWVNYVLNVPMYFIRRNGTYFNVAGASFKTFMKEGMAGHRAMLRDFLDHLSTVFTEVRLKPQLEMRSADCGAFDYLVGLPAFWKGIIYSPSALAKAQTLIENPSAKALFELRHEAAVEGMQAQYRGVNIERLCQEALTTASEGLREQGEGEAVFLKPFMKG